MGLEEDEVTALAGRVRAAGPVNVLWPGLAELHGRSGDLEALDGLRAMGMRVVCVSGPAGAGTSQLVRSFTASRIPDALVLDLAGTQDTWDVLVSLAHCLQIPVREFAGEKSLVDRIAATIMARPGLKLVIDHAGDAIAVEVLRRVARRVPGSEWILAGAGRLGVAGEVGYELAPLGREDALAFFTACGGPDAFGPALVESVGGCPLAIRLMAGLCEVLHPLRVFERLSSGRGDALRVLDLWLERLDADAQPVVRRLAAVEGSFDARTAHALGVDPELWQRRGFIEACAHPGLPGIERWRMAHPVRSWIHERLGIEPDDIEAIAAHLADRCPGFVAATRGTQASVAQAWLAAERSNIDGVIEWMVERRLSSVQLKWLASLFEAALCAAEYRGAVRPLLEPLESALQAVARCLDVDPLVAVRLFRCRGRVFELLGDTDSARSDLQRARSLAERWKAAEEVGRTHLAAARVFLRRNDGSAAEQSVRAALGVFESGEWSNAGQCVLAEVHIAASEFDRAAEALGHASDSEWPAVRARVALLSGAVHRHNMDFERCEASLAEALQRYLALEHWEEAALAELQLGLSLQGRGALGEAAEVLRRADETARRWGDHARRGVVLCQLGLIALEKGDVEEARRTFIRAISASRIGADRAGQGAARGFLALTLHLEGELERSRVGYREALRDLEAGGDRRYGALFHSCLGAAEAELGNVEEARILVDLAHLRLPDADPTLRDAIGLFHRVLDLASAARAEGVGDFTRAKDLRRGVLSVLGELEGREDNIYLRFARAHLQSLIRRRR